MTGTQSLASNFSRVRSLATTFAGTALLVSMLATPGLAESSIPGNTKTGNAGSDQDVFTITNETLDAARRQRAPMPARAPQPSKIEPAAVRPQAKGPNCLSVEVLNKTGARAAEMAEQYFLAELDQVAKENDLNTPGGWTAAAADLDVIATKLHASAAEAYDPEVQRMLFGFAQDLQETASWVQTRPHESAEKFRRGEPIFSGRF